MTQNDVRELLRKACDKAGSVRRWAMDHELSNSYVSRVLQDGEAPGASILEALSLEKIVVYQYRRRA